MFLGNNWQASQGEDAMDWPPQTGETARSPLSLQKVVLAVVLLFVASGSLLGLSTMALKGSFLPKTNVASTKQSREQLAQKGWWEQANKDDAAFATALVALEDPAKKLATEEPTNPLRTANIPNGRPDPFETLVQPKVDIDESQLDENGLPLDETNNLDPTSLMRFTGLIQDRKSKDKVAILVMYDEVEGTKTEVVRLNEAFMWNGVKVKVVALSSNKVILLVDGQKQELEMQSYKPQPKKSMNDEEAAQTSGAPSSQQTTR